MWQIKIWISIEKNIIFNVYSYFEQNYFKNIFIENKKLNLKKLIVFT